MFVSGQPFNKEQRILEIAERLFLEKGFALTTTVEIARMAGCNQALVHYYFRTKEKLFQKIFEAKARLFISAFLLPGEKNLTFEEKLKKKIESHFDILAANPKLPFLFFNEITTNPERFRSLRKQVEGLPESVIRELQHDLDEESARGSIRPVLAIDLLLTILSLNVVVFLGRPVMAEMVGMAEAEYQAIVARRKQINVDIILHGLRPCPGVAIREGGISQKAITEPL